MFNVLLPLPPLHPPLRQPPTFFSFFFFFRFFSFSFSFFCFTPNFEARLESSNFELRDWNFEVWVQSSKFELRSWNFEQKKQCSMLLSPLLPPATHFFVFRFCSSFSFFVFFSTPNFEARLQSSTFEIRSWNFLTKKTMFQLRTWMLELGSLGSKFKLSSTFEIRSWNFEARLQCSNFELRCWNLEVWVQSLNFEVGTSLGTHGRAHLRASQV